ncbi:MAG: hypothetical protein LBT64_00805 [Puniceicoccales bacterium]|jgi:hypothetical protein|nr:hypothetical protein [Puniceicoccales bacterium]
MDSEQRLFGRQDSVLTGQDVASKIEQISIAKPSAQFSNAPSVKFDSNAPMHGRKSSPPAKPTALAECTSTGVAMLSVAEKKQLLHGALDSGSLPKALSDIANSTDGLGTLKSLLSIWVLRGDVTLMVACVEWEQSSEHSGKIIPHDVRQHVWGTLAGVDKKVRHETEKKLGALCENASAKPEEKQRDPRASFLFSCTAEQVNPLSPAERRRFLREAFDGGSLMDALDSVANSLGGLDTLKILFNVWVLSIDIPLTVACILWERASPHCNRIIQLDTERHTLRAFAALEQNTREEISNQLRAMCAGNNGRDLCYRCFALNVAEEVEDKCSNKLRMDKPSTLFECTQKNVTVLTVDERKRLLRGSLNEGMLTCALWRMGSSNDGLDILKCLFRGPVFADDAQLMIACLAWERSSKYKGAIFGVDLERLAEASLRSLEVSAQSALLEKLRVCAETHALDSEAYEFVMLRSGVEAMFKSAVVNAIGDNGHAFNFAKKFDTWNRLARSVAAYCFGSDGKIDGRAVANLRAHIDHVVKNSYDESPFDEFPDIKFVCSQMLPVFDALLRSDCALIKILQSANAMKVGEYGLDILKIMGAKSAGIAILHSLICPHRQRNIPTCTIDSIVIAELRNSILFIAKMYVQIMTQNWFSMPSGFSVHLGKIENGYVVVDLEYGGRGRNIVFSEIFMDTLKISGIECDPQRKFSLKILVKNLNDIFFAKFFQSNFGNSRESMLPKLGTMHTYAGLDEKQCILTKINVHLIGLRGTLDELQKQAKIFSEREILYMHIGTSWKYTTEKEFSLHACNMDTGALLQLNFNAMEPDEVYHIGDCNWMGNCNWIGDKKQLIGGDLLYTPHLSIKKLSRMGNAVPIFGVAYGQTFNEIILAYIEINSSDVHHVWERKLPHGNSLLPAMGNISDEWKKMHAVDEISE